LRLGREKIWALRMQSRWHVTSWVVTSRTLEAK
jgi:hypothetical protein